MLSRIARPSVRQVAVAAPIAMLFFALPAAELFADQSRLMLPRYRLQPGQELVYQVTASEDLRDSKGENGAKGNTPRERSQWHITVVRENDDGSWRLLIRSQQAFLNPDGSERRQFGSFDYCDLRPDGSYSLNEQTAMFKMLVPYELFCRLPDTPGEMNGDWHDQPPARGIGFTYRVAKSDGPSLQIAATQNDDYSQGRWQLVRTYEFDQQRGFVTTIVLESQDAKSKQPVSRRTIALRSQAQHDANRRSIQWLRGRPRSVCAQGGRRASRRWNSRWLDQQPNQVGSATKGNPES